MSLLFKDLLWWCNFDHLFLLLLLVLLILHSRTKVKEFLLFLSKFSGFRFRFLVHFWVDFGVWHKKKGPLLFFLCVLVFSFRGIFFFSYFWPLKSSFWRQTHETFELYLVTEIPALLLPIVQSGGLVLCHIEIFT